MRPLVQHFLFVQLQKLFVLPLEEEDDLFHVPLVGLSRDQSNARRCAASDFVFEAGSGPAREEAVGASA